MSDMIKYVVECNTVTGVIALLILCTLLAFVSFLLYKVLTNTLPYIVEKITAYNDVRAKAVSDKTSVEVELHRREEEGLS